MSEQLFTATADGTKVFGFVEGLSFHYLKKSNHDGWIRYRDEIYHFTDLHEVKVVDMDAVVIEGVSKAELVAELKDAQSCLTDLGCCVDDRHGLIPFLAQLSTPAEPATGGGMKSPAHQTTEITTTSVGKKGCCICDDGCKGFADGHELHHFCSNHGKLANPWMRINCSNSAPQSPKGVTIDGVSAEEIVRLIKVAWVSIVRSHYETGSLEMVGIAKAILDQISSNKHDEICAFPRRVCTCINQLTPTPKNEVGKPCVTEPLGIGARVNVGRTAIRSNDSDLPWSWQGVSGLRFNWSWITENYASKPILLSEGVEG